MIRVTDEGIFSEHSDKRSEVARHYAIHYIIDSIIDEIVEDKCTEVLEDEVFKRFRENVRPTYITANLYYTAGNQKVLSLAYKPQRPANVEFVAYDHNILNIIKKIIRHNMNDTYQYCFKNGRLAVLGDKTERELYQAAERARYKAAYAKRKANMPHSVKLKKQLRSENVHAISAATYAVIVTGNDLIDISPSLVRAYLRERYDVDGGEQLNKRVMAEAGLEYVKNSLTLNESYLK